MFLPRSPFFKHDGPEVEIAAAGNFRIADKSLENNALEIALHALCDCVLAAPAPRITDAEIEKIELLHVKMELADDCVSSIRRKRGSSGLEISV